MTGELATSGVADSSAAIEEIEVKTPKDISGTAAFLASSAADYLTGQCIYVDGGFMAGDDWPLPEAAEA